MDRDDPQVGNVSEQHDVTIDDVAQLVTRRAGIRWRALVLSAPGSSPTPVGRTAIGLAVVRRAVISTRERRTYVRGTAVLSAVIIRRSTDTDARIGGAPVSIAVIFVYCCADAALVRAADV